MSLKLKYSKEIKSAKEQGKPILAMESTIIAHGMPYPQSYKTKTGILHFNKNFFVLLQTGADVKRDIFLF